MRSCLFQMVLYIVLQDTTTQPAAAKKSGRRRWNVSNMDSTDDLLDDLDLSMTFPSKKPAPLKAPIKRRESIFDDDDFFK